METPRPSSPSPPPRLAERRALEAALAVAGERVLCTTLGRAQAAAAIAEQRPQAQVACWFLDEHHWRLARQSAGQLPALSLLCQADLPDGPFDLAVVPCSMGGEAELTRELLQAACQSLAVGGKLVAAVDNPDDRWLHGQMAELFPKVTVQRHDDATVYRARKGAELRRVRAFRRQFAFRDRGRLLQAVSRPGVFAHGRIDPGARQLLAAAEVTPRMKVLDIGCGAGTVAIGIAAREASVRVHAVDGNARAVACTAAGAELNGLTNLTVELNCTGEYSGAGQYDLALANPHYYADFRIAALFLAAARRSLRSGGKVLVVTKHPAWYEEHMPAHWREVRVCPSKQYYVVSALRV